MSATEPVRFGGMSPYLYYEDAEAALEWLARVFGFTERVRFVDPNGVVRAAEMYAGDTLEDLGGNTWTFWQHLRDEVELPEGWRRSAPEGELTPVAFYSPNFVERAFSEIRP